jgi:hypothetical protein
MILFLFLSRIVAAAKMNKPRAIMMTTTEIFNFMIFHVQGGGNAVYCLVDHTVRL